MKTPESYTIDAVKKWAQRNNRYAFRPVQMGIGAATLDFLVCFHGQFWGIECKKEGKSEPTARQAQTMREIRAAGGKTFLVTMSGDDLVWLEVTDEGSKRCG